MHVQGKPLLQATKQQIITNIITIIIIIIIIIINIIIMTLISYPTRIHTHCTLQHSPTFYQLNGEQMDHWKFPNNNYVYTFIYYDPKLSVPCSLSKLNEITEVIGHPYRNCTSYNSIYKTQLYPIIYTWTETACCPALHYQEHWTF